METPQSQIDDLVARPAEGLPVEIKSWIDPASSEGIAKIVRAALAMRNQNGGFLIIGLNDKTMQVDSAGKPDDVRQAYHVDKIQQLVSRYAYETFEIEVGFAERDGVEIPVIVMPAGVQFPIACKADLLADDGKKLLRSGEIYCRTLNSNGSVSTAAASPKDWRGIFERCFENREADIGRFLRRHLGSGAEGLFGSAPQPSRREQMHAFLDAGLARMQEAADARKLTEPQLALVNGAKFEAGLVLDPLRADQVATRQFLDTLAINNPRLTGWPIWLDSSAFVDQQSRPMVRNGSWEALILIEEGWSGGSIDYNWFDPAGRFYLLRSLQDDTAGKVKPGKMLEPIIVVLRVAETIAVGLSYARALGWEESSTLHFAFRWSKLAGRQLNAWAHPGVYLSSYAPTGTDSVASYIDVPLDTSLNSIAPSVGAAVRPLFAEFGGFEMPDSSIEHWVQRLTERRL